MKKHNLEEGAGRRIKKLGSPYVSQIPEQALEEDDLILVQRILKDQNPRRNGRLIGNSYHMRHFRPHTSLTKEAFQGCREFLCISVPSAVMICLQWWSFELLILLSGLLPKAQLETSGFDKNRKKILLSDLKYL
ncbi:hypothetical protein MKW98_028359 [Papaver atlanticum]|uniref:Uncharacterized protein n=1 Tax=Papaver atlanticum TaxID=357466 RepID=A0AAD4SY60_9MAGN|nr:hypothetical protein MKW98_028359 [Papaver atlanticum]